MARAPALGATSRALRRPRIEPAPLRIRAASVIVAVSAGTREFRLWYMVNTKQNLTLQQKRFRAAVDYSSCICKSGGEAARGSLPALSPQSDQVISCGIGRRPSTGRAPDPSFKQVNTIVWFFQDHKWKQRHASVKRQAPSVKHQAPIFRKLSNQPG